MQPSEIHGFLADTAPFCYLDLATLEVVIRHLSVLYCTSEEILDPPTGRLVIIRSGRFSLIDEHNNRHTQLVSGDCYGYDALIKPGVQSDRLVCEEDGLIYRLTAEAFHECLHHSGHFKGYFEGLTRRALHQYHEPNTNPRITVKIEDLISTKKVVIAPGASVADAARLMTENRVSSLLVEEEGQLVGIITDRDLRSRVVAQELDTATPVENIMSRSPRCVEKSAFVFEAVLTMSRHNVHHLPVTDRGKSYGMITLTDIIRAQQKHPVYVISDIHHQMDIESLQQSAAQLPALLADLAQQEVPGHEVSHIITLITDALTQRLVYLAQEQLGPAPCRFCWLAFGSQARMDQSINADQDNALLLEREVTEEAAEYFAKLADFVCSGLARCGIPLCPGNIMASNPELRLSLDGWMRKFLNFIHSPDAESILGSVIFFDARGIAGDLSLMAELHERLQPFVVQNSLFFFHLANAALERTPPLSMLRNFILEKNADGESGVDVKKRGLSLITDIARVYALSAGISTVSTRERLQRLMQQKILDEKDGQNLLDAFEVIANLRWRQHKQHLSPAGEVPPTGEVSSHRPSNLINPQQLHVLQREQLKDSFQVIIQAQAALRLRFCRDL